MGSDNLNGSRKQALCKELEQLVTKLDSTHAENIQFVKSEIATDASTTFSKNKNYFQDLLKQYQQTEEIGNQISLVSSKSAGDKDPNKTVIDTGNGVTKKLKRTSRSLSGILPYKEAEYNQVSLTGYHREDDRTDQKSGAQKTKGYKGNRATTAKAAVGVRTGA